MKLLLSSDAAPAASTADLTRTWRRWLFGARGWGCNTAAQKRPAPPRLLILRPRPHE